MQLTETIGPYVCAHSVNLGTFKSNEHVLKIE
jgi:hypothetical protein